MATKLRDPLQLHKHRNIRTVPRCKYIYNDPDEKTDWQAYLNKIEKLAKKKARDSRLRQINLWSPLPARLRARVSKHIKIPTESEDELESSVIQSTEGSERDEATSEEEFNESTISAILDEDENSSDLFKPNVELPAEKRVKPVPNINWIANYTGRRQKDRIKWKSKFYKLDRDILEKPLFEQAEEVMDKAAESFAEWVNSLGACDSDALTKESIKRLFSIEMTEFATTAVHIEPKELKVVPNVVAQKWNLPELCLENQVEKYLKKRIPKKATKPVTVAFGRTLPFSMRPWVQTEEDADLKPYFPDELITKEILFKGITHLRSTKNLIEHYMENPNLPRPQYLEDIGSFKREAKKVTTDSIPLYELFKQRRRGCSHELIGKQKPNQ